METAKIHLLDGPAAGRTARVPFIAKLLPLSTVYLDCGGHPEAYIQKPSLTSHVPPYEFIYWHPYPGAAEAVTVYPLEPQ